ncbi:hypothetical protein C6501_19720 [Candidatus Poribacteria bacterium]|nr:MAG: hypothetical protein C6501_19720 [Candidatus Poribacteria bacterium]
MRIMRSLMKKSDAELIHQILSGNEAAFSDLVQKYQKSVHALAWRKIGDFHIAEEITQDIFLHVYKKLPTLKDSNQFAGWLYVIANRQCIAWLRKKKQPVQSLEATSQDTLEETAYACYISEQREEAEAERRREIVQNLLEKLPESERTVIILHYLGEMTCEAISKFLGVSPNTVKSRLSRARKRLREEESLIRETLGTVPLSPNLTANIMRDISNVEQTPPSVSKPLLPFGALGSSVVLIILLLGASNQYLTYFQLPYSFDAQSETAIEIVEVSVFHDIQSKPNMQKRVRSDATPNQTSKDGLQKGKSSMQNNLAQDSTKWKLPEGAKTRLGKGHIFDMVHSPDGKLLAAAGTIGIWIYDAHTGEELNLLTEHMESASTIAFSPDNSLLASDGKDNTILLCDPHTGKHKMTLTGHTEGISSVAFSPDGKTLASGSEDETIRLWDVVTGEQLLVFAGHAGRVSEVIYSPDGEMLASHGRDEMIHLWDAETGEFIRTFTGHTDLIWSIAYSPDGKAIASGSEDRTIRFWDTDTGHLKTTLTHTTNSDGVTLVVFSPDGQTLVSADYADDMIQFWNVASGERLETIKSPPDTTNHIVFSPDGRTLVNAGSDGTIRFWDVATTNPIRTLDGYAEMFRDMAYSPDGNTLATVSTGPSLRLWDPHTGRLKKIYAPGSVSIACIAYAPDGVTLACGPGPTEYDTVYLFNTETGERGRVFTGHKKNGAVSVAFSPDGQILASGGSDGAIHLWDVSTSKTLKILEWHNDYVRTLAFSPDGKMLVSTSDSGSRFWNIATGEPVKDLKADTIVLSPDWEKFVSIDMVSRITQFWNMDSEDPLKTITSEEKTYFRAYSPDGCTIVGIDSDGQLSFCDASTGEVIHTFENGHIQGVWFMSYSPDGRTLATGGWDSTVLLWDVPQ